MEKSINSISELKIGNCVLIDYLSDKDILGAVSVKNNEMVDITFELGGSRSFKEGDISKYNIRIIDKRHSKYNEEFAKVNEEFAKVNEEFAKMFKNFQNLVNNFDDTIKSSSIENKDKTAQIFKTKINK